MIAQDVYTREKLEQLIRLAGMDPNQFPESFLKIVPAEMNHRIQREGQPKSVWDELHLLTSEIEKSFQVGEISSELRSKWIQQTNYGDF